MGQVYVLLSLWACGQAIPGLLGLDISRAKELGLFKLVGDDDVIYHQKSPPPAQGSLFFLSLAAVLRITWKTATHRGTIASYSYIDAKYLGERGVGRKTCSG